MVKFINKLTGSEMWIADDRVEEYKAAGHKLAADSVKAVETTTKTVKKTATKKAR